MKEELIRFLLIQLDMSGLHYFEAFESPLQYFFLLFFLNSLNQNSTGGLEPP